MAAIRNSLTRLARTPVRTALFFLLLSFTVALVCAGGNLWKLSGDNVRRFEEIFTTIGTVEQTPERMEQAAVWYADRKDYRYFSRAVYGETISPDVLDFEGAGYLSGPEQRAYYEALPLDYKLKEDEEGFSQYIIMEASPLVDCVPAGPVKMDVKRVLYSVYPVNFNPVNLCDHNNEHPQKLYADKTYLMAVADGWAHDFKEKGPQATFEYAPIAGPYSTQADADGNRLSTALTGNWIVEVTPGFYDTKEGQDWLNLCEEHLQRKIHLSLPVTATQNLNLIMAFYTKQAYVAQGESFSQEDYRQGNKVCLVSDKFAVRNGLKVGDSLHLALRYANYAASPGRGGAEGYLKADGGVYEVFEESDYTIKGIYEVGVGTDGDWGYVLDRNEVFIPDASIKNSNADSIALHGPMKGYTTSFQIPNGSESMENYRKLWEAQGVDHVEITFYDGGYSRLEGGLKNMRTMSAVLLTSGIVSAVCIVVFFCHLFITRQRRQTAIERGLGMTKRQCAGSLLAGILVVAFAGSIAGSLAGQFFAGRAVLQMAAAETFDTRFSNGEVQFNMEKSEEEMADEGVHGNGIAKSVYLTQTDWRISVVCGGLVFLFTMGMAFAGIHRNLREEPLKLLAEAER